MNKDRDKLQENNKKKKIDKQKGENDMETVMVKKNIDSIPIELKEKLNKITTKISLLKGKDNMIELNPDNPQHKEWYEKDNFKGR